MPAQMDILGLLETRGDAQRAFHQHASQVRDKRFGSTVFIRGVVEVSNFCRQNCRYCAMRRDNRELKRFRIAFDELAESVIHHRPPSITDIDIQAGEDPVAVREIVLPLVREIRQRTDLGVTLCLGTLSNAEYDALREAGGEFYVLKVESGNAAHYSEIEAPGTLTARIRAIEYLASTGWKVSSGFIIGLPGQTPAHVVETFDLLGRLPLAGCSVSPFIAGPQTPFADDTTGDLETTLNCVALMRQRYPQWFIPAVSAMRLVGDDGYVRALQAGANLTTINLTPIDFRSNYPIYTKERLIMDEDRVLQAIDQAGCKPSRIGVSEYLRTTAAVAVA